MLCDQSAYTSPAKHLRFAGETSSSISRLPILFPFYCLQIIKIPPSFPFPSVSYHTGHLLSLPSDGAIEQSRQCYGLLFIHSCSFSHSRGSPIHRNEAHPCPLASFVYKRQRADDWVIDSLHMRSKHAPRFITDYLPVRANDDFQAMRWAQLFSTQCIRMAWLRETEVWVPVGSSIRLSARK